MGTMTIRGLDERTAKALKAKAKQEGISLNATLLKILKEQLGLTRRPKSMVYTDLDHLAGTWDEKDYRDFNKRIEDFERIDEKMWK